MKRTLKQYLSLSGKGLAMGAADVVPGVSGGTVAFITGIYEELIATISSVNFGVLKTLRKEGVAAAWNSINGNFLVALFIGIGISIVSLSRFITYLLDNHPVLLWSFFFGLIVASVFVVGKQVKRWNNLAILGIIAGTAVSYFITELPPAKSSSELWFIGLSGMIAICAMILPGISGSFILLLLGSYKTILTAVKEADLMKIAVFAGGCIIGLLAFSKALNWMFKRFHDLTVAILTGFLIGSLNKIWPWKETVSWRENSAGEQIPFIQQNILPQSYDTPETPALLLYAIGTAILGFAVIFVLEKSTSKS